MPPGIVCAGCLSTSPACKFTPVRGGGTIRSWTVVHDAFLPSFRDELPFVLVDVELDVQADLRMVGRLVDGPSATFHLGDRVTTVFDDLAPGVAVLAFALADRA